jgi:phage shock protein A
VAVEVERLHAQHADAVREKSAAESKSHRLAEKVATLEAEKTDLWR